MKKLEGIGQKKKKILNNIKIKKGLGIKRGSNCGMKDRNKKNKTNKINEQS